jgi:hypothetical protein
LKKKYQLKKITKVKKKIAIKIIRIKSDRKKNQKIFLKIISNETNSNQKNENQI